MRGSHAPIAAVGAAAVLVAALGGSALSQSPSVPASVAPLASPLAAGSPAAPASPMPPVAVGPVKWKIGKDQKVFSADPAVYSVGQLPDGRLIVVGSAGKDESKATGAAWVSPDGSKWSRVKGLKAPARSAVVTIGNIGPAIVATGRAEDGTGLTWTSADGSTWSAAVPMSGVIYDLTTTASGLLGVGTDGGAATAWTSADGVTWQPTTLAPSGRALHVMADKDGTLVATGAVSDATGDRSVTPAVWSSTDGTTWTMTLLPGLPPGQWSSPAAAWTPAGFVATFTEQGQTGSIGHVWSSPDGLTWAETYVDQNGASTAAGAAGTDAMLIGHSQVLRSPDGTTWTPTKAKAFDGYTVRDVMTLADGRLLAAGDYFSPMGGGMVTWIGTAEPLP